MVWSERVVVRDGVRLVCRDWGGRGQPVVLLHGLAGHAGEWEAVASRLGGRYRVVAVDQRGHGASERYPRDVSRAAHVADVVSVVEQLGLCRPVLVGQSLGGHTAMLTAAFRPALVRGLVLVEAGPGGPAPGVPVDIGGWLDGWPAPFPSLEAAAVFFGGGAVGAGWAAGLEERDGGWWPRFDRDVMVRSIAEAAGRSYLPEWKRVVCPTLLVLGQSSFVSAREAGDMLWQGPIAVAMSVPGTGHDLHLERPDLLHAALEHFLDGLARES
ncbi:alpha/beta fold hydrolase [Streptomyces globisporus]|uniref:alpha/beta fold hydrolase n=1 Tax=Streptomyces globisporus TaxID=1908 RepID=UPI003697659C